MDFQKIYSDFLMKHPNYSFDLVLLLPKLVDRGVLDYDESAHIERIHIPTQRKLAFFKEIMPAKGLECHLALIEILEEKKLNLLSSWLAERIQPKSTQFSFQVSLKPSDFVNQRYLDQGSFGKVFAATYRKTNLQVALKKIMTNPNDEQTLRNEAELLQSARHSHIVHILGVVDNLVEDEIWIVTELLNGGSLRPYCTGSEKMDGIQKLEIGLHCWSALAYLHDWAKITHRDIKPENILLHITPDTRLIAKLCDFGLAKENASMLMTEATALSGTLMYFPPEFEESRRNPQKVDVYSLGATLCELFTNKHFWHDVNDSRGFEIHEIIYKLVTVHQKIISSSDMPDDQAIDYGPAAVALDQCVDCSDSIKSILRKSVSFNRQKRPSANQVYEVFQAEFASASTPSKQEDPQSLRSLAAVTKIPNANQQSTAVNSSTSDTVKIPNANTQPAIWKRRRRSESFQATQSNLDATLKEHSNTTELRFLQISDQLDVELAPITSKYTWKDEISMSSLNKQPFATLSVFDLVHSGDPRITNHRFIGSFNFFQQEFVDQNNANNKKEVVLLFPGFPLFKFVNENASSSTIKKVFEIYSDIGSVNLSDSLNKPLDAIFLSVIQLNQVLEQPEINFQEFDFVIDINHLGRLFGFCGGLYTKESIVSFDMEKVNRALLFGLPEVECGALQYLDGNIMITVGRNLKLVSYQFGQLNFLIHHEADCTDSKSAMEPAISNLFQSGFYKTCKRLGPNSNFYYRFFDSVEAEKCVPILSYDDQNGYHLLHHALFYFTGSDRTVLCKESDWANTPRSLSATQMTELVKSMPFFEIVSKTHDCLLRIFKIMASKPDGAKMTLICNGNGGMEFYEKKPNAPSLLSDDLRLYLQLQAKNEETIKVSGNKEKADGGESSVVMKTLTEFWRKLTR